MPVGKGSEFKAEIAVTGYFLYKISNVEIAYFNSKHVQKGNRIGMTNGLNESGD